MSEDNSNTSDKITIKVRHSDEDYHVITIDWSNDYFGWVYFNEQLFSQLSAYTGIPVEQQQAVKVTNVGSELRLENIEFGNGWPTRAFVTKEEVMDVFHDDDRFMLTTSLSHWSSGIHCCYELCHQDLVNQSECNRYFCHYLGTRFFTERFSALVKAEHLQSILHLKPGQTWTDMAALRLNLNIQHLVDLECRADLIAWPHLWGRIYNNYSRNRG